MWLLVGMWALTGIIKKIDRGKCPLFVAKAVVKHILLRCSGTRKWESIFELNSD
jgi:hypothetical protein